jgi:bifunctional non-homologous end joining protein LigD
MVTKSLQVAVHGQTLQLSNLDKLLYPAAQFTKAHVIDYYSRIAPAMLPHLAHRPVTLKRYPNGVDDKFFFQKNCPSHHPNWLTTANIQYNARHPPIDHCLLNSPAALVWAANLGALELHTSLALARRIDQPRSIVFDLDPGPPAGLLQCVQVALHLHDLLHDLNLDSFVKTSGKNGLHLYVPLNTPTDYDHTKTFAQVVADWLTRQHPQHITSNMRKDLRRGKVFVDWSQNTLHKTTVCVYSLRATAHPTVSTPLTWDELAAAQHAADHSSLYFQSDDVLTRVQRQGDLFEPLAKLKQKLPKRLPT